METTKKTITFSDGTKATIFGTGMDLTVELAGETITDVTVEVSENDEFNAIINSK